MAANLSLPATEKIALQYSLEEQVKLCSSI